MGEESYLRIEMPTLLHCCSKLPVSQPYSMASGHHLLNKKSPIVLIIHRGCGRDLSGKEEILSLCLSIATLMLWLFYNTRYNRILMDIVCFLTYKSCPINHLFTLLLKYANPIHYHSIQPKNYPGLIKPSLRGRYKPHHANQL